MDAQEEPTCGKGLAENSILPAKLSEVIAAMAKNLETHTKALDLTDPDSRVEYDAYENLVHGLQQSATQLRTIANQMEGYRGLRMGRHDQKAMTHPTVREVFENFVNRKQELLLLLRQTADRDNSMLEILRMHQS